MYTLSRQTIVLSFIAASFCSTAHADLRVTEIPIVNAPQGSTALGAGFRSGTSPYRNINNVSSINNDNDFDLVPLYLYEGEHLFAHGTSFGVHAFRNDNFEMDFVARYRFDRLDPDTDDFYTGMDEREQTLDGGVSLAFKRKWGKLGVSWISDLQDNHNGNEWSINYRYTWFPGRWSVSPFISYVYQDSKLTDYYYGVREREATENRPAYQAGSASYVQAGINTSYRLSKNLLLFGNIASQGLDDSVTNSPLVDENQLTSALVGFSYLFGNLQDNSAYSQSPFRVDEWSWRINYGYTAEETFYKPHQGYVKRSEDVHSYLAGFTLGKLLQDGEKLDYWGRFSINRRLENDTQDDFWEYNAYVMAMGTGYSPWTERELFRYGFGFGFSYAQRVPMVEQIKQNNRDGNTSHFLNYLEAQVDVPLQRIFGEKAKKNCYVGLTLVHRSGIFGNADILNNVSGGSDVLTGHIECKQ
jgi:outer membrane scaffolding protein for murein synthesis (MipA/OmpV family)